MRGAEHAVGGDFGGALELSRGLQRTAQELESIADARLVEGRRLAASWIGPHGEGFAERLAAEASVGSGVVERLRADALRWSAAWADAVNAARESQPVAVGIDGGAGQALMAVGSGASGGQSAVGSVSAPGPPWFDPVSVSGGHN